MLINSRIIVDGTDITDLIAYNGFKWSRHDVDGPNLTLVETLLA